MEVLDCTGNPITNLAPLSILPLTELNCSNTRLPVDDLRPAPEGFTHGSHNAVGGLKYDDEVLPAGTRFRVHFDLEKPTPADEALFGAALFEWSAWERYRLE